MQAKKAFLALIVAAAGLCIAADQPPDFLRLGWEKATNPYKLPDWFEGNRVQAHTRLSLNWHKTPEFINAAEGFKAMGAKVFTRHAKTGSEDPWWPTLDVKAFVDDAHAKGLHVIAYNWMMTDKTMETLHPDWVCKSPTGEIIAHRGRGNELDVTGPYREVILKRLMDLAEMGFDGFYFDEAHLANVNVQEQSILTPTDVKMRNPGASYKPAFELGNKVSPYLSGSMPVRWAAVHFSELSRNRREGDHIKAWREVLWPMTGAFGVLTREHLPVGIVNDYQLEKGQLDGYKLLFLPNPDELTSAQRKVVDKFKTKGGVVIENDPSWRWDDPKKTAEAAESFRRAIAKYDAPIHITGGPKKMHTVCYQAKDRLTIALTNDFAWVQMYKPKQPDDLPKYNAPPAPINGVEIIIWGKPPSRVFEAVSGKLLKAKPIEGGYKIQVPEFGQMALAVVE